MTYALILCSACTSNSPDEPVESRTVTVEYVIDGDTIIVDRDERVRFLGIDAPEVDHGGNEEEPCGAEATQFVADALDGQTATLIEDPTQPATDRYGRTLAYVEAGGEDLSAQLLDAGLAEVYMAADDISRWEDYRAIARTADHPKCLG